MTDFEAWYLERHPDLDPNLDDAFDELRSAFNAGAVSQASAWREIFAGQESQAKTLRDEFAGQALNGWISSATNHDVYLDPVHYAGLSYEFADAMLEARKTPKGEAR
jgi:hypothetical protein